MYCCSVFTAVRRWSAARLSEQGAGAREGVVAVQRRRHTGSGHRTHPANQVTSMAVACLGSAAMALHSGDTTGTWYSGSPSTGSH